MNRREEEAEQRSRERAREDIEKERLKKEADEIARGKEKFAKEHPDGYDDLNGVCHVGSPKEEVTIGPAESHGNQAGDQPAELYAKYDKDGNFLKWGVSQDSGTRYDRNELKGGVADVIATGSRKDMLQMERWFTERAPGPENHESWAGAKYSPQAIREVKAVLEFLDRVNKNH